jgi:branched-chain amino acid transport system substrate-binding protein
MKRRTIGAAFLLMAVSCSGNEPDIVIGAVYPTTGGQGMGGIEEFRGLELARDLVNGEGGIDGRKVRLELRPVASAEAAPGAVEDLVGQGIDVIAGSYGSTISRPAADAASRLGAVFWETGAVGQLGPDAAVGERVFRFPPTGGSLGQAAVAFIRDRLAPLVGSGDPDLRYGVVYVDDVYGRSVAFGAIEEINQSGLEHAGPFPYDLATADFGDLARQIGRSGVDVLVVAAYLEDGVAIRRALVRSGVPLVANIGTSSSYCMPAFGEILGEDAVGVFASDKPDGDVLDPAVLAPDAAAALQWARAEYRARFEEPMPAAALSGFAGGWALFRHVLPAARDFTAASVADAARAADLPAGALPNGSGLRFAPPGTPNAGANLEATSVIWEWVAPGARAIVWPPAYATGPIVPPLSA